MDSQSDQVNKFAQMGELFREILHVQMRLSSDNLIKAAFGAERMRNCAPLDGHPFQQPWYAKVDARRIRMNMI